MKPMNEMIRWHLIAPITDNRSYSTSLLLNPNHNPDVSTSTFISSDKSSSPSGSGGDDNSLNHHWRCHRSCSGSNLNNRMHIWTNNSYWLKSTHQKHNTSKRLRGHNNLNGSYNGVRVCNNTGRLGCHSKRLHSVGKGVRIVHRDRDLLIIGTHKRIMGWNTKNNELLDKQKTRGIGM